MFEDLVPKDARKDKAIKSPKGGGLFSDLIPTASSVTTEEPPYLGIPEPLAFDESKALLTWSTPSTETSPIIRAPLPSDRNAPEFMQPSPGDVVGLAAASLLTPEFKAAYKAPQSREDVSLLRGKGAEVGQKVGEALGWPLTGRFVGRMADEALNPISYAEAALMGEAWQGIKRIPIGKATPTSPEELAAIRKALALEPPTKAELPLYPERKTSRQKMYESQQQQVQRMFPDEPPEIKAIDTPPTTEVTDAVTGKTFTAPAPTPTNSEVKASVQAAAAEPLPVEGVTTPRLTVESSKILVDAAENLANRNPDFVLEGDTTDRFFKRIGKAIRTGVMSMDDLDPKFRAAGYTNDMVADLYETAVRQSGQTLQQLSAFTQRLSKDVKLRILNMPDLPPTLGDKLNSWGKEAVNVWRASLVSQLQTASRNLTSGLIKEHMIKGGLVEFMLAAEKAVTGRETPRAAMGPFIEHIYAVGRRLSPESRKLLADTLEAEPILKNKLYGTPVSDVLMTRQYAQVINVFNKTQEFFVRNVVMEAEVRKAMLEAGKVYGKDEIPYAILDRAVNQALRVTMASTPRTQFARNMVEGLNKAYLFQLGYPFPRFLANSLENLYDWSLIKPIKLYITGEMTKLPVNEQLRTINRAVVGTSMQLSAIYLREKLGGEKWYEYYVPVDIPGVAKEGQLMDIRPWGPDLPVYSFLAELYKRMQENEETGKDIGFTAKDYMEGMSGINRLAGSSLLLASQLESRNLEAKAQELAKRFAGEILGGFSTPFRTFRDLIGAFSEEEKIVRDVRQAPLTGPFLANIPFASRTLPEKNFPTSTENERVSTGVRQIFGLTLSEKDPVRTEIERLRIDTLKMEPRTGNPEMDNLIRYEMAKMLEKEAPKLFREYDYRRAKNDAVRELMLKGLIGGIKAEAIGIVEGKRPDLSKEYRDKLAEKDLMLER